MTEETRDSILAAENEQTDTLPPKKGFTGQRKAAVILLCCFIAGCCLGLLWFIKSRTNIETDNAFIEAQIHPVSPRISGTVINLFVRDNQIVKKGDLLLELDPADYRINLEKAEAELGLAKNETSGDKLQVAASRAAVQLAKVEHHQALIDLQRGNNLFKKEVIPKEQLERLQTALNLSEARLKQAEETLRKDEAIAGIGVDSSNAARIRKQKAVLDDTRLKLGYTRITAPVDGYITRKGVETGATVQAGQSLMAIVPLDYRWITANYKESQLTHIKPGQKVTFRVDAYPDESFKGTVDSIMAGTGAAFSLLPPENATGNYVKVVQRIPVKILIDKDSDPKQLLRVGMSVEPVVLTGRSASAVIKELF